MVGACARSLHAPRPAPLRTADARVVWTSGEYVHQAMKPRLKGSARAFEWRHVSRMASPLALRLVGGIGAICGCPLQTGGRAPRHARWHCSHTRTANSAKPELQASASSRGPHLPHLRAARLRVANCRILGPEDCRSDRSGGSTKM